LRTRAAIREFVVAWLASSLAFTVAFVAFMVVGSWLYGQPWLPLTAILRLIWLAARDALIVLFFYGGFVYLLLTRVGLWRFWTIAFAYLLPVWLCGALAVGIRRDVWTIVASVVFVCIVAGVFRALIPASRGDAADELQRDQTLK
jgi:hypothetical protein